MLAQGADNVGAYTHRYPTDEQVRELVADPISYRITYKDGLRATMLLMNGLVGDFNFAAKLKGQERVVSTLLYLDSGGTNAHNVQCKSQDIAERLCDSSAGLSDILARRQLDPDERRREDVSQRPSALPGTPPNLAGRGSPPSPRSWW